MARVFRHRLRAGALIGAGILLGAALLKTAASTAPVAPAAATPTAAVVLSSPDGAVPSSVHATVRRGSLSVSLTVAPVEVGPVRFLATISEDGKRLHDGVISIRLSMPAQPIFGLTTLPAAPCAGGYCAQGTLSALGRWRAEVLVRGRDRHGAIRAVPFDLMDGANARFLFAQPPDTRFGPATTTLSRGADGTSLVRILLRPGLAVRAAAGMPNMASMGSAVYAATAQARGWYSLSPTFPMTGVQELQLQVRAGTRWRTVRTLLYDADSYGRVVPLTNTPG